MGWRSNVSLPCHTSLAAFLGLDEVLLEWVVNDRLLVIDVIVEAELHHVGQELTW